MFKTTLKKLGAVSVGTKHHVEFPYEDVEIVYEINLGCGCTSAFNDPNLQKVVVIYTAQAVPQHFINQSQYSYTTTKTVTVVYQPKGQAQSVSVNLSFEVTVKQ